jgi:hypothetical protein
VSGRRLVVALVAVALAGAGAGCGGAGPSMTSDAARKLAAQDQAVHLALAGGDRGAVDQSLVGLRDTVATLQGRGQLSADRAHAILAAVDTVQTHLVLLPTTTTTTTTTPTLAPPDRKHQDHGGGGGGGGD